MQQFIIRTFVSMCSMSFAAGILLWLDTKGIHPDRWVSSMIGYTETALSQTAIWLIIIGISGLIGVFTAVPLFEFGKRIFTKKNKETKPETGQEVEISAELPSILVGLTRKEIQYDDYERIFALTVNNTGSLDLDGKCLVKLEYMDSETPSDLSLPFVLRTDGQIRGNRSGRFSLSSKEHKTVPILFRNPKRKNEWYLFDEQGNSYFIPARDTEMTIGVYGGKHNKKYEINFTKSTTEEDFNYFAELKETNDSLSLKPDITISEAVDYLINILFPDRAPHTFKPLSENPKAVNLITEKLRTGQLKSWGLYMGEYVEREFNKEDWKYMELLPFEASFNENIPQTKVVKSNIDQHLFTGLRVNFNQVKSLWPEK